MNRNPTIALIIDSPLLRDALTIVLQQNFPTATFVSSANGADALRLVTAPGRQIDIAVISDVLPDIPGDLLVRRLRWYAPQLRAVMVDSALARRRNAARAGDAAHPSTPAADGAADRSGGSIASIIDAIHRILPDLAVVPRPATGPGAGASAADRSASGSPDLPEPCADARGAGREPAGAGLDGPRGGIMPARPPFGPQRLTPRQMEVLGLLAQGWRNSTIAEHLHTSEKTVKAHVSAVFQVLDVSNRTQATLVAQRSGLVPA